MTKRAHCQACINLIRGVKNRQSPPHVCVKKERERVESLVKTKKIIESGYAGVNQKGTIVDRREFPDTVPIPENPLFNTPPPKEERI